MDSEMAKLKRLQLETFSGFRNGKTKRLQLETFSCQDEEFVNDFWNKSLNESSPFAL